jgi:hypothetical protein
MKLGIATCGKIAKAMVGEGTPFPSRSIRELEQFLHEHDIDEQYRSNDSKHKMACRAVNSLDTCDKADDQLHQTLSGILEALAGSKTFSDFRGKLNVADQQAGVEYLNEALSKHGMEIRLDDDGEASLCFSNEVSLSKGAASVSAKQKFVFQPRVFRPEAVDLETDSNLVSVMMPFEAKFNPVLASIREACENVELTCVRADNIWNETTIIDEIFSLICRSGVVVCDLTDRNPNVLYEMGIAQTLGKPVVMITQQDSDIPFDVKHHRYLKYLNNDQGRGEMRDALAERLATIWNQEFSDGE